MDILNILVMAVVKQSPDCKFDRLHGLANSYHELGEMMRHKSVADETYHESQKIAYNVPLFSNELLNKIDQLVFNYGHSLVK